MRTSARKKTARYFFLEARVVGRERKEISCRKESEAENSGAEVEIMAGAMLKCPTHRGKQMKCFADMSKHDDDLTGSPGSTANC